MVVKCISGYQSTHVRNGLSNTKKRETSTEMVNELGWACTRRIDLEQIRHVSSGDQQLTIWMDGDVFNRCLVWKGANHGHKRRW